MSPARVPKDPATCTGKRNIANAFLTPETVIMAIDSVCGRNADTYEELQDLGALNRQSPQS